MHKKWHFHKDFSVRFILLILTIPIVWILMDAFGWLSYLEYESLDWRFNARGELPSPAKIIYVDLDSQALKFMGEQPLPRSFFAEATEALFEHGKVSVLGIDIVFSKTTHSFLVDKEKSQKDSKKLKEVIQKYPNLVLAISYTPQINELLPGEGGHISNFPFLHLGYTDREKNGLPEQPDPSLIGFSGGNLGLINLADHYSPGAIPRWVPLFAYSAGPTYYHMSLEMVRVHLGIPKENITITDEEIVLRNKDESIAMEIPLEVEQLLEINWFSKWSSSENIRYSLKTILAAKALIEKGSDSQKQEAKNFFKAFEDAIVLIGPVDTLLHDLAPTPFDKTPVPKVGVHGNLIKTILGKDFIHRLPNWFNLIILFFLTITVAFLGTVPLNKCGKYCKFSSVFVLIGYIGCSFYLFSNSSLVLPFIAPVGSSLSTTFIALVIELIEAEKQKGNIKSMFGAYVSKDLVEIIIEQKQKPHLGGEEKEITALFSDIENFSSISETLRPTQLINLMNEYLSIMTSIVQVESGTLDKYIGDAIVSMFGAPISIENHALAACRAACKMQQAQKGMRIQWRAEIGKWNDKVINMHTRIGINTGLAVIGNMGSNVRFNYTMLGDNVNLSARCESAARYYGIYSMTTDNTRKQVEPNKDVVFRKLDKIIVKGKTQAIGVHEIVGFRTQLTKEIFECIETFEAGLEAYYEQNWDKAIKLFKHSVRLEHNITPNNRLLNPSLVFINRCQEMQKNSPGPNWDGVYKLSNK